MAEEYEDEEFEDNINSGKEQKPEKEYKTTEARRRATAKYEKESVQGYTMRVPKGRLDELQTYCKEHHEKDKRHPKYQSLNTLIIASLEKETGIYLRGILEASKDYEIELKIEQEAKKEWIARDPLDLKHLMSQISDDDIQIHTGINKLLDNEWEQVRDKVVKVYKQNNHLDSDENKEKWYNNEIDSQS